MPWPKGKPRSAEERAKISASLRGREVSEETRRNISAAAKLREPPSRYERTPEIRAKTSASLTGKSHTPERRARSSQAHLGTGVKHGLANHPHYFRWSSMMDRCYNPLSASYPDYGGRGIGVHAPWHDIRLFIAYLDDELGRLPPGYSLDRIDNDGDYGPDNIRWASPSQQSRNRRPRSEWRTA